MVVRVELGQRTQGPPLSPREQRLWTCCPCSTNSESTDPLQEARFKAAQAFLFSLSAEKDLSQCTEEQVPS